MFLSCVFPFIYGRFRSTYLYEQPPKKTFSSPLQGIVKVYGTNLLRAQNGSLTYPMNSTIPCNLRYISHPKDNKFVCLVRLEIEGSPIQWEGRRIKTERNKDFVEIANYSYDGLNLRTRAVEEIYQGREREFFDVLRLYASDIEVRINLRTKECRVSKPPHAFFPIDIPLGGKFLFETEVGPVSVPNEHLTQQTWEIKFSDDATYSISVTSPDCVPLTAYYNSKTHGAEIYNYFNITAGIRDPSIFNPPPECS